MILTHITVQNLGAADFFAHDFSDGLNLVKSLYTDEISYAIRLVLHHKAVPLPMPAARGTARIEALVCVEEKQYRLTATPAAEGKDLLLRVYDEGGADVTKEYLYLTSHCPEHDLSEVFRGESEDGFLKVLKYVDEDDYYRARELTERTDGLSDIGAFRSYLRSFVRSFQFEPICEGKRYEFVLEQNGRYGVRYTDDGRLPVFLSESERMLFRYLCFLRTAEFWRGFEELRNLHGIHKPLLVGGFLERLDESIDVRGIADRTARLGRQVILLSVPSEKRTLNDLL